MGADLATLGNFAASKTLPHPATTAGYRDLMPDPLPKVVADNVIALLKHRFKDMRPHEKGVTRLVELGLSQGTAARVLAGKTQLGLDVLEDLAKAFRMQPWQLLVQGLDPAAPPGVTADVSWPFEMVSADAYWALSPTQRVFLQGRLQQWLEVNTATVPERRVGNGR